MYRAKKEERIGERARMWGTIDAHYQQTVATGWSSGAGVWINRYGAYCQ